MNPKNTPIYEVFFLFIPRHKAAVVSPRLMDYPEGQLTLKPRPLGRGAGFTFSLGLVNISMSSDIRC